MTGSALARVAVTLILLSSILSVWFTFNNVQQPAYAIESQNTWATILGRPDLKDEANSIQQTSNGGYIMAGEVFIDNGIRGTDVWVVKLEADGKVDWEKTYGAKETLGDFQIDEIAQSVFQTADGGYIILGEVGVEDTIKFDAWLLKLDSDGNIVWQKTYTNSVGRLSAISQSSDGGYLMAGRITSPTMDLWLIKVDSEGNTEWEKTYGPGLADTGVELVALQPTTDGGYIVGTNIFGAISDAWILKLDSDGNVEWEKAYGGEGDQGLFSIDQSLDGGYVVGGAATGDVWVLRLDSDGNIVWQNTYGGAGGDSIRSLEQTSDGGYIVGARTNSFGSGNWLLKLDSDGNVVWQKVYHGPFDHLSELHQAADGGYISVGTNGASFESDAWILKLDSDGNIDKCTSVAIQDTNALAIGTVNSVFDTSANKGSSSTSVKDTSGTAEEHTSVINVICNPSPSYSLNLFEGTNPSDLTIDLGQEARAAANTTDPAVNQVNFTWNNPSGEPVATGLVSLALTGQAEDTFTPDEVGRWTVEADFGNGIVKQQTFDVRMLVVPESSIGPIALITSSLAVLGAYMYRSRHRISDNSET